MPSYIGSPAVWAARSLSRNGTPRNGPSGSSPAAASRALSNSGVITALSSGFSRSMRAIASSTSSVGLASPVRTSSAWAVASRPAELTGATYPTSAQVERGDGTAHASGSGGRYIAEAGRATARPAQNAVR